MVVVVMEEEEGEEEEEGRRRTMMSVCEVGGRSTNKGCVSEVW